MHALPLPTETISLILSRLSAKHLLKCREANSVFHDIVHHIITQRLASDPFGFSNVKVRGCQYETRFVRSHRGSIILGFLPRKCPAHESFYRRLHQAVLAHDSDIIREALDPEKAIYWLGDDCCESHTDCTFTQCNPHFIRLRLHDLIRHDPCLPSLVRADKRGTGNLIVGELTYPTSFSRLAEVDEDEDDTHESEDGEEDSDEEEGEDETEESDDTQYGYEEVTYDQYGHENGYFLQHESGGILCLSFTLSMSVPQALTLLVSQAT